MGRFALQIVQPLAHHLTCCALEVLDLMDAQLLMYVFHQAKSMVMMDHSVHNTAKLSALQEKLSAQLHLAGVAVLNQERAFQERQENKCLTMAIPGC